MFLEGNYPVGLEKRLHGVKQRLLAQHGVTLAAD